MDGSPSQHTETLPCFEKPVELLIPAVICRLLTVLMDCQEPKNLTPVFPRPYNRVTGS